ncbi:MAG: UDP-glucose 4-epimerase [Candidatus Sumerlaeota bacterium]|nr:UDP-glucose 4-epimerase [Candidatus Sumerlaeota bacterium]
MSTPTSVLITGGAGFIGSHLARAWVARGARVVVLDSLRTGHRANLAGVDCQFVEGSVEDAALVRRCAEGIDVIHHLAALVSVPESMEKPALTEAINVLGTLNVLEAARAARVGKVVFSSTSAVYGMIDRPMHAETDLPAPASPYAITKLAGEHYMHLYAEAFGVPTICFRYFNVYGPRQDPKSPYAAAVAIFADLARAGKPLRVYDDGEQTRDFVHVNDVVAANLLGAETGSGVFNVACGTRITVNDLARKIIATAGSSSQIEYAPPRPGDIRHSRGDSTKLRALGWQPAVTLDEGLQLTLNEGGPQ